MFSNKFHRCAVILLTHSRMIIPFNAVFHIIYIVDIKKYTKLLNIAHMYVHTYIFHRPQCVVVIY